MTWSSPVDTHSTNDCENWSDHLHYPMNGSFRTDDMEERPTIRCVQHKNGFGHQQLILWIVKSSSQFQLGCGCVHVTHTNRTQPHMHCVSTESSVIAHPCGVEWCQTDQNVIENIEIDFPFLNGAQRVRFHFDQNDTESMQLLPLRTPIDYWIFNWNESTLNWFSYQIKSPNKTVINDECVYSNSILYFSLSIRIPISHFNVCRTHTQLQ